MSDSHPGAGLADLYRDLHRHPELSFAETRTAGIAAERLRRCGYEVTEGVGRTGVVGVLRNGDGPTALLRADMDALPVAEDTGLDYASTVRAVGRDGAETAVAHACGHDMHVTCLVGAAAQLAAARDTWRGTLLVVFQPAEEFGAGADAMLDDGLYDRFGTPDVVLGQHVAPLPAGLLAVAAGPAFAGSDSLRITLHGGAGTGRARRPPSTRCCSPRRRRCGCTPSSRARSPRPRPRCSASGCCGRAPRRTSSPTPPSWG